MIRNVTKVHCTIGGYGSSLSSKYGDAQPGDAAGVTSQFCKPSYSSYVKSTIFIQHNIGGCPTTSVGLIMELTSQF